METFFIVQIVKDVIPPKSMDDSAITVYRVVYTENTGGKGLGYNDEIKTYNQLDMAQAHVDLIKGRIPDTMFTVEYEAREGLSKVVYSLVSDCFKEAK